MMACSGPHTTVNDIRHYTGIELCAAAGVRDLTTTEERDGTAGFSFHVVLHLPASCKSSFEQQLASLAPSQCPVSWIRRAGCVIKDAYPKTAMHTSIIVRPLGPNRYDLRFFE